MFSLSDNRKPLGNLKYIPNSRISIVTMAFLFLRFLIFLIGRGVEVGIEIGVFHIRSVLYRSFHEAALFITIVLSCVYRAIVDGGGESMVCQYRAPVSGSATRKWYICLKSSERPPASDEEIIFYEAKAEGPQGDILNAPPSKGWKPMNGTVSLFYAFLVLGTFRFEPERRVLDTIISLVPLPVML